MDELLINGENAYTTWGVRMGEGFLDVIGASASMKDFIENKTGNGVPHMRFSEYIKDKILICLLHFLCMILLMGFFYITGYNRNAAALILIFWWIILGIWSVTGYYRRKKYFRQGENIFWKM